jgi:hypothetical protein
MPALAPGKSAIMFNLQEPYFTWPLLAAGGAYAFKLNDGRYDVIQLKGISATRGQQWPGEVGFLQVKHDGAFAFGAALTAS